MLLGSDVERCQDLRRSEGGLDGLLEDALGVGKAVVQLDDPVLPRLQVRGLAAPQLG